MVFKSQAHSGEVFVAVQSELQKEMTIVAAVRQVVDVSGKDVSIGSRHAMKTNTARSFLHANYAVKKRVLRPFWGLIEEVTPIVWTAKGQN